MTAAAKTNFATYRKASGVGIQDIAKDTGLTPQRLYQIEKTGICPSETASAIADSIATRAKRDPKKVFAECFYAPKAPPT